MKVALLARLLFVLGGPPFVLVAAQQCNEKVYAVSRNRSIKIRAERSRASVVATYNRSVVSIEYDHIEDQMFGLAVVVNSDYFALTSLDPERGLFDQVGKVRAGPDQFLTGLAGLAMDETTSKLYTYSQTDTKLWEFKLKTGKVDPVFRTGIPDIIDMASDPRSGLIYATTGTAIYRINQYRKGAQLLADGVRIATLWFSRKGLLYGIREYPNQALASVHEINKQTGKLIRLINTMELGDALTGSTFQCKILPTQAPTRAPTKAPTQPNVLMIAIDDMNDWVGYLGGHPNAYTPNIDSLARKGVGFLNAHAVSSVCLASRTATLYGKRPTTTGIYENGIDWHSFIGRNTSLLEHFKQNGFDTIGTGKLFHGTNGLKDDVYRPKYWTRYSDPLTHKDFHVDEDLSCQNGQNAEQECIHGVQEVCSAGLNFGPSTNCEKSKDDYQRASWIIERLQESHNKPFFMAIGFSKPHLPLVVPKKYFDLVPLNSIQLPKTKTNDIGDLPAEGKNLALDGKELGEGLHATMVESNLWKPAVQAYLAAIAFADETISRVVDALENSEYGKNTIIVLWSDHGFHLGEKRHWKKGTLWEECTRVPFVVVAPGLTDHGIPCEHPVDLMSIFPTLVELTGLPPIDVEGQSLVRLLSQPRGPWNHPAISSYRQHNMVRNGPWRYIQYLDGGEELYNIDNDVHEWNNLARKPEYKETTNAFRDMLPKNQAPPKQ